MENPEVQKGINEAIFEVALSLPDAEVRKQFLQRTFQGDTEGLERFTELLESSFSSTSFFLEARDARGDIASDLIKSDRGLAELIVEDAPPPADRTGSWIDCYRLGRCLGEGGSGTVYEAEQVDPIQRIVALKIIKIDTQSAAARARFDIERQALAIMDHPNIAKVLDAGGILDDTAYFVMELVEGESITHYCDRGGLTLRERLRLFIDICDAIQHAHSKGIIHRDIKPSNVLVTVKDGRPVPKVIDFGIAKSLATVRGRSDAFTGHDQFLGTPAYMSPEQVAMIGVDVDTRSDVYSLGALLYEILTSFTPFDKGLLFGSNLAAMRDVLRDRTPLKPSSRIGDAAEDELKIIAAARGIDPSRLGSSIRGDLDWIVMKSLDKDRNHRYETANGLALDLRRYLENQPVTARSISNFYSMQKFVQRNKIPVFSAVLVCASILLGLGSSTTLYLRERRSLAEQSRLSEEAGKARDQESRLRGQAQARANVSRAAFLLSEGQIEEADKLIQANPLDSIEPSKEAAVVFRALGSWYANYGRWKDSVHCYQLMNQANKMTGTSDILRSSDLLATAAAFVELRDMAGYKAFRNATLARHSDVHTPLEAEHLLKACLWTDAPAATLSKLAPAAAICESSVNGTMKATFPAWEAFSLALYHHRNGDYEKVITVGKIGLSNSEIKESCASAIRSLMAMAQRKLGRRDLADANLASASLIYQDAISKNGEDVVYPSRWYDWAIAAHLLDEVETALKKK